ncbi:MAG: MmcQ/YjbR family DNA-binding protein [Solirubrobacterales bacterium]|nr:MmcQ/YjbR family DNA-binding protein [Solirubrobacterales bacterium]
MTHPEHLDALRRICLALPEAAEQETWESATFRVRGKIFAMTSGDETRSEVWCKAGLGVQAMLIAADARRFFSPPYVGPKGWIGIRFDNDTAWEDVRDLIAESFRLVAPKRLVAQLPTVTSVSD